MDTIQHLLNMAAAQAIKKNTIDMRCFRIGSVGVRNDGAIVYSRNLSDTNRNRRIHSEYRLARKLDFGAIVFVARVLRDGITVGMARPCPDCERLLRQMKVRKVYYTIAPDEYGVLVLDQ